MDVRRSWPTDAAYFLHNCCANSSDHEQASCAVIGRAWRSRAASARPCSAHDLMEAAAAVRRRLRQRCDG
ncbi:hypothetical protein F511_43138 [Dorcoceras hygrometricum]|uniref:Uncharacterized protein n=1 Tax=Dorcoceras hygrometricum TaxID=472368 RepID=A0A2Z7CE61_9LAMI|nr:hypothetical protein F511_43138 [Dorcoceras hygrometricum]